MCKLTSNCIDKGLIRLNYINVSIMRLRNFILFICVSFEVFASVERREFVTVERNGAGSAYGRLNLRINELEAMLRRCLAENEVIRHELERARLEIDKVKQDNATQVISIKENVMIIKREVGKITSLVKTNVASQAKPVAQASDKWNKSGSKAPDKTQDKGKSKEPTKSSTKESIKERIKRIKGMIENERYTLSLRALNEISASKNGYQEYVHFYKGMCLMGLKRYNEASYSFLDAYNVNKKSAIAPKALKKLAECFSKQGQQQKAKIVMDKIKVDFPSFK